MALTLNNRIQEYTTSTGVEPITLSGAITGYVAFSSGVGTGNTCYYVIDHYDTGDWEIGLGTLSGSVLTRTTVYDSSTGGTIITFAAGQSTWGD